MKKLAIAIFVCLGCTNTLFAQTAVFPNNGTLYDGKLHKVELRMHPDTLEALLDDTNRWTNHSYPATFIYDHTDTLYNVGVRMKGNTSRESKKLSFKIDVDEYVDQTYQGLKTFNLNGNHNDPSISREYISANMMAAAGNKSLRANPVQLYLNGALRGIYSNAEQINKKFLESRFTENKGNLYKCSWPAELKWLGSNQQLYKDIINPSPLNERAYELKTNESADDYSDLVALINVVNNTPASQFQAAIDTIFDVQAYLKVLATEILIGHWDNYFYNKNNYYLYHTQTTKKFVYLPYDMDNTWGVQWGVSNIDVRNIYDWGKLSNSTSPLTYKILAVPQFKKDYETYLRQLCQTSYTEARLFGVLDSIKSILTAAVAEDPFYNNTVPTDYGYTTAQWAQSYTQPIDDHATVGLKPFITNRRNSVLAQLPAATGLAESKPLVSQVYPNPNKGVFTIEVTEPTEIKITDLAGRIVFTKIVAAGNNMIEADLTNGWYTLQLQTGQHFTVQKILVQPYE